ncbi:MAG: phosphopantothenate/pantothenate synthetase [Candidatus Poseidoniaceae archaeon]|nr:phosphopantothenate/pantothenate synthetase [Candidatus Poseidoniaceae archaeon]
MGEHVADPSHPRYRSLLMRHRLEEAASKGMLANSAMIAHGRGEAYDYLLGEQTIPSALEATKEAAARLLAAKRPLISLNGNAVALAGKELLEIAQLLSCPVEVNIFYRTPERMAALLSHLEEIKDRHDIDVEILGAAPDGRIPGLEGPRANCHIDGILNADVILVPLEDGDRCEALVAMGKEVLVVDLNPLSRTARMATVSIVDELSRVALNLVQLIPTAPISTEWNNQAILQSALSQIVTTMASFAEK